MTSCASSPGGGSDDTNKRFVCRVGYAAHGLVYLLIGAFAIDAAIMGGGEVEGSSGAIAKIGGGLLGTVLLTVLAAGLLAYCFLRLWQGIGKGASGCSADDTGFFTRAARVIDGLAQAVLAFYALSLAYGWFAVAGGGSGDGAADLSARVMSWPAGQWVLGITGVCICVAAFSQLTMAVRASFLRELAVSSAHAGWIKTLGRIGFSARFVVFLLVGGFIVVAAYEADASEARGLGGALRTLQGQPYGAWLLAAVAAGLIAFACMRGVYARFGVLPGRRGA